MIKHGQPMSQVLVQMQVNELKMNDPKLNKIFDKLKKGDKVKLKTSSTISKGNDFVEYLVKSKNVVNKGKVEKITLVTVGNEKAVKKFLYKRDGAVTFAIGDMGASIDDIKEKYSLINHEIVEDIEEVEIDEGAASDARRSMSKDRDLVRRGKDSADVDDTASDADKKAAMKNMVMQMRQALDVRGNKPIEFEDGKKQKVDPKILNMLLKAHEMIPKPRDKEQFVKMISKSYRDMLKVSKMVGKQLRMGEEIVLDEGFSPKEIKMAIGIASDPRYKQGNYSGAVKQIEKIKKGLSTHKQVAAVLKRQNENLEEGKMKDLLIKTQDLMGPSKNREQGIEFVMKGLKVSKKEATKLVDAVLKMSEEVELDEKYDLYHKSFSDAMQHAYDYAKKKLGITVDPKEIDSKVATGPKKPSEGKTNKYRLKGKGGNLQIQVYNKGGSKPFELNMYKEENEMTKSLKDTIVEMWSEAVSPAQQAAIAISKKEKEEQDEGNAFGAALQAARENGDETFVVSGKTYKCEDYDEKGQVKEAYKPVKANHYDVKVTVSDKDVAKVKKIISNFNGDIEDVDSDQVDGGGNKFKGTGDIYIQGDDAGKLGMEIAKAVKTVKVMGETNKNNKSDDGDGMDAVQPKAVKKKFKDRKDKDIDNDGDVDDSDKFLHKRRKAVSKAINSQKESIERYHETKKGSLRDAVLQMWGENVKEEKKDLTKEKKDGIKNSMTDTGKEMTKVEVDAKMPKIKETKNKV